MNNPSRRSFLTRFSLGISSLFAFPFFGFSKAKENQQAIKRIKPLGFQWETQDPFLFCVHHEDNFPEGNSNLGPDPKHFNGRDMGRDFILKDGWRMYHGEKVPGFPSHPHRGFETITVVRKGVVDHADSLGASGRYGNGDVQWMTAGRGVQHSEMFPLVHENKENPMELFQIWLNLPKRNKMVNPHYKMLWREDIPIHTSTDAAGKKTIVEVIVGELNGDKPPKPAPDSWAFDDNNQVAMWNIKMEPHAQWTVPKATPGVNRTIYFYEGGSMRMDGKQIAHYHAVEVDEALPITLQNDHEAASLLILQGKPINEPVVQHGPFVMNTKQEIKEAFNDFHKTQFGGWPWSKRGQVHAKSEGRFAHHVDGRKIIKD